MTTPPTFPNLIGQGWSVHKRPIFLTRVASHVSGREVRDALYAHTLYEYELVFNALTSSGSDFATLGANSLQELMGFFLTMQGQLGTFLYDDPSDNAATAQALGTGDGATTTFSFVRTLGTFAEPVGWVTGTPTIYLNGAAQTSGYAITPPNTLTFTSAPASGVAISADFTYAFQCRFLDDTMDFENLMQNLWAVKVVKFRSVKV
ncbi:MAG TPA: DUF2460 domain-containing protein [Beijerinckiaceae bacterium]|nr:DUF2460 domain-containing protein [Beijerinckiaceae bacterium]